MKLCYNYKVEYSHNRCFFSRGKSILTQTEMFVVFMLDEIINQGSLIGQTAGKVPKSLLIWNDIPESATET